MPQSIRHIGEPAAASTSEALPGGGGLGDPDRRFQLILTKLCHLFQLYYYPTQIMRQRLDLDALLRKYETNYSPRPQHSEPLFSPRASPKLKLKLKTETDRFPENDLRFFNTAANRAQPQMERRTGRDKVASVSFQMSKSECEALLLGVQEELAGEQRAITNFVDQCMQQLLDKFQREHEQLRRQLSTLLDHSLEQSRKTVLEMVQGYRRQFPRSYTQVGRHIAEINQEVNSLLGGLAGSSFRKTIAEVVTRDFSQLVRKVREQVTLANTAYRQQLASIELDRSKVAKVQESLHRLYSWRREQPNLKVSDDREDFMKSSRRSSKRKIFENRGNNKMAMTQRQGSEYSAPKNMRRTFFNFDSNP